MSVYTNVGENGDPDFFAITANTSGVQVVGQDNRLMALTIYNGGSQAVYLYHENDAGAAVANGYPVAAEGGTFSDSASRGPLYAFTESSTSELRVARVRRVRRP